MSTTFAPLVISTVSPEVRGVVMAAITLIGEESVLRPISLDVTLSPPYV